MHREYDQPPLSIVDALKHHASLMKTNAFRKSHGRRSDSSGHYLAPLNNKNGVANFV